MILNKIVKAMLFPTGHIKGDWYKSKGYKNFDEYLEKQRQDVKQPLNGVLSDVEISQYNVDAYNTKGHKHKLEAVEIKMKDNLINLPYDASSLPCKEKHIVVFLGRSEFYQYDLRDLSIEALKTGATVHGFNYSGMYASTGEAKCFEDLVNDGFAVVHKLIKEKNIHPNDIILQGNCLGSAVADAVARKIDEHFKVKIRQINSNSFKSIRSVIIHQYPFLEIFKELLAKILRYTRWEIKTSLQETSPYACYIHRTDDKTIGDHAKVHTKMEKHNKTNDTYGDYDSTRKKLDSNAEMSEANDWSKEDWKKHYKESWLPKDKQGNIVSGTKYNDPHELHLYQLKTKAHEGELITMFDFINTFVKESDKYIANDQKREEVKVNIDGNNTSLQEMSKKLTKKEMIVFSRQEEAQIAQIIDQVIQFENEAKNTRIDQEYEVNIADKIKNAQTSIEFI